MKSVNYFAPDLGQFLNDEVIVTPETEKKIKLENLEEDFDNAPFGD
jgi:hypothetical protein